MRPLYHKKADRLRAKADRLEKEGWPKLAGAQSSAASRNISCSASAVAHIIMGLGGENDEDTAKRIADYEAKHGPITDEQIVRGMVAVLRQDAFNHAELQAIDGRQRQRHERDVHGRQHRLQHRLWLHAALQSASVSVDELALPGRRHD